MPHQNNKLTEIKTKIRHVIANLQQLQNLSEEEHDFNVEQVEELQRNTTTLLDELDQVPIQKVVGLQTHRKRRRLLDKQKNKRAKCEIKKPEELLLKERKYSVIPPPNSKEKQAEHISLRKQHDAAYILENFDLLEKLCESRGGDSRALSQKLAQMRHVWRRVQEESEGDDHVKESKIAASKEPQWEAVFFGKPSNLLRENKTRFREIRSTWDSYISLGERGSCVPTGWVLPLIKPISQWAAYISET
ncbi:uncharacterized protein LOC128266382 [Drosophila gunungcola]|uniref:Uncharacterized protein n=1 Tax=Drosophila gunungcola TaxID=103775 RepID=A0A9P9YW27_9MUSC|nr:uncharacterized protein LOC128266382 [Drosophila gunungcola]KAI8044214.1 hypothetical protein M5D96_000365 [Drosophila gunungcola]